MSRMAHFEYSEAPYCIREDLSAAYANYWQHLAQPGSWWTGLERVAIAREVRNATTCEYCEARKEALSPYNFPGDHTSSGSDDSNPLKAIAIDAVHRVITDQSRITGAWIDDIAELGLTKGHYVELVGITVTVFSIDEFHRGLGLPLEHLPEAIEGEPDHYHPVLASAGTGYVPMLPVSGKFTAREKGLWPANRGANVLRALSLVPDAVRHWQEVAAVQYLPTQRLMNFAGPTGRSIDRMQTELVAGRVSSYAECFY